MKKETKKLLFFIFSLFLILRAITLLAGFMGIKFLPFKASFPYADAVLEKFGPPLLWSWANFDGVHYLMIAKDGYVFGLTQAFFPLFILLIRFFNFFVGNQLLVGLFLSHFFFIASLYVFYKLVCLDFKKDVARWSLVLLTIFPTAFFFLSLYTESLFLFLILSSFYFLRKKKYISAGIIGALASATRITGIFLVPAFVYEIHRDRGCWIKDKRRNARGIKPNISYLISHILNYFPAFLPSLGLLSYMWFLKNRFNDPFLFAHVQEGFGGGRTTDKLVLLYQVFWRYFKMIITVNRANPLYFTIWLEVISAILFLGLLIFAYIKKIRKSYLIFAALAFILPTLTGTFSSMPRYVLGLFPCFMALSLIKNKIFRFFWITICLTLLIINTMMFIRGYWIA